MLVRKFVFDFYLGSKLNPTVSYSGCVFAESIDSARKLAIEKGRANGCWRESLKINGPYGKPIETATAA
jgi:hypothetical protein